MNALNKTQYYFVLALFRLLAFLPLKVLFLLSEMLTFIVYHLVGYRKNIVFNNLRNSFPEKEESEIKFIARKYYRHLSVMIVENIYLRFANPKKLKNRIIIEKREVFDDIYKQGRSAIVMLGHMGNWEFGGGLAMLLPFNVVGVYKKLSSEAFDKIYFHIRSQFGALPVEMKQIGRKIIELNRQENPSLIFMVADQSPPLNDKTYWLKFLNQDTDVFLGSEKLANKFNMPVVYMEITRHKKGVYKMIPQLITMEPKKLEEHELTKRFFKLLEESIRERPRYWLWSHRRWKHSKNHLG